MDEIKLESLRDKLETTILNIKHAKGANEQISPNSVLLAELKNTLNEMLEDYRCTEIFYTLNTDKQFFGVTVSPSIDSTQAVQIVSSDVPVVIRSYKLELDSKLFDLDLEADEIMATILYEITSMLSGSTVNAVRDLLHVYVLSNNSTISIRDSINYYQLIIYAIKDTMYKVSSLLFKEDIEDLMANNAIQALNLQDPLVSAQEKIISSAFGSSDSVRSPKTIILQYVFMVYRDISHNARIIRDDLRDAVDFTASVLIKSEIDKTLKALDRIGNTIAESTMPLSQLIDNKVSLINEISLFKSLKQSGLRAIDDDFYEYAIRAKAAEDEPEAMSVLHSINTRLSILDDYVDNTPDISDYDKKKYEKLADKYRSLRDYLAKKKIINKKQYGVFIDYSQYDHLDDED